MKRRMDVTNIVNELSAEHARQAKEAGRTNVGLDFELFKAYEIILDYCKNTKSNPCSHSYRMDNGDLYIDSCFSGRVGGLINRPGFMREGVFHMGGIDYETKILARQEVY